MIIKRFWDRAQETLSRCQGNGRKGVTGNTGSTGTSLPASSSYKVILTDRKISSVEIDGQLSRVTEWVLLTQPVPINPGRLLCRWSSWEAFLWEGKFRHRMTKNGRTRL